MHTPELVTVQDIVDAYNVEAERRGESGIGVHTVRDACRSGALKAQRVGGGWVITEAAAAEWLASYERYARRK